MGESTLCFVPALSGSGVMRQRLGGAGVRQEERRRRGVVSMRREGGVKAPRTRGEEVWRSTRRKSRRSEVGSTTVCRCSAPSEEEVQRLSVGEAEDVLEREGDEELSTTKEGAGKVKTSTKAFLMFAASFLAVPVVGLAAAASFSTPAQLERITSGLYSSLVLVLASEIGDKTFFISALMSMKYSKLIVFLGTMIALGLMTVISVIIGQLFHAVPATLNSTLPFDDYAAVALLLWFGYTNIRDSLQMSNETEEDEGELKDAEDYLKEAESGQQKWWRALTSTGGVRLLLQTFTLVFVAEWGDKSMLATIALAAAKSPVGVVIGGCAGHLIATILAVLGGAFLGKYISEKRARLIGGVLFLVFAVLTLGSVY